MLARIAAIALNAYREAVRARILFGLLGVALATCAYSVVLATLSLHQEARVVADVGAASMSFYAILVAIIIAATALHREIEMKTIFPILSRPLRRHEYVLGKYFGTVLTITAFLAIDGAVVLLILGMETGTAWSKLGPAIGALALLLGVLLWRAKYTRVFVLIPWAIVFFLVAYVLASPAGHERQLVVAAASLALAEVLIVTAIATLFSSFSSPFLTAVFTFGVFLVGRSADTLANLPSRLVGEQARSTFRVIAKVLPNLQIYVPARPLLLGEVVGTPLWPYVAKAALHSIFYAAILLVVSAAIFQKRDFQ